MQVSHGNAPPLRRIRSGDRVVFYSPTEALRGKDRLRAFTAIGIVKEDEPYQAEMGGGFSPFRRDVAWQAAKETSIEPLLEKLEFTWASGIGAISCASACSRSAMPTCRGSRRPWVHRWCDGGPWAARQRLALCRGLQQCSLLGGIGNSHALHLREHCELVHPIAALR
jgi:EVE domain